MEFTVKHLTDHKNLISHLVLSSMRNNSEAIETLPSDRTSETLVDVKLLFNGVELDINGFIETLESTWNAAVDKEANTLANERFEILKQKYISKNSTNAQLNKIREQLNKSNNILLGITSSLDLIK